MIIRLAIRLVVLAVIIDVVARIIPSIDVHGSFVWLLWVNAGQLVARRSGVGVRLRCGRALARPSSSDKTWQNGHPPGVNRHCVSLQPL